MNFIFVFLHIVICIFLIISILMQSSKGGGLSGAFGGGGAMGAAFGGRGAATFLSKATAVLAVMFMLSNFVQIFLSRTDVANEESLTQRDISSQQVDTSPAANLPGVPQTGIPATTTTPPDTNK